MGVHCASVLPPVEYIHATLEVAGVGSIHLIQRAVEMSRPVAVDVEPGDARLGGQHVIRHALTIGLLPSSKTRETDQQGEASQCRSGNEYGACRPSFAKVLCTDTTNPLTDLNPAIIRHIEPRIAADCKVQVELCRMLILASAKGVFGRLRQAHDGLNDPG